MNMLQLVLFGIFLYCLNVQEICAAQKLNGQSSDRIRSTSNDVNPSKLHNNFVKEYTRQLNTISHRHGISPTFIQSRYFHFDQFARDNRDIGRPSSYRSPNSPTSYYKYGGIGTYSMGVNQEGCRLKDNLCSHDYQCCSGKCRCVRWSVMGKMSCWKKCF